MKLLKQCSIALLGIVILTYVIIKFYEEESLKEGIPPFVIPPDFVAGSLAFQTPSRMAADATEMVGDTVRFVGETTQSATETTLLATQSATENVAEQIADTTRSAIEEAGDAAQYVASEGSRTRNSITALLQRLGLSGKATTERTLGEVQDVVADTTTKGMNYWMYAFIVGILVTFSGYIVKVGEWSILAFQDTIKFFTNFTGCFFWYTLDIIGKILYLIPQFIFWLFDLQDIEKQIWEFMHKISCKVYEFTSFHLIYFPQDVINKCYTMKAGPFPNPIAHFKNAFSGKDGARKFFGG
jgi:hypothetical protein